MEGSDEGSDKLDSNEEELYEYVEPEPISYLVDMADSYELKPEDDAEVKKVTTILMKEELKRIQKYENE